MRHHFLPLRPLVLLGPLLLTAVTVAQISLTPLGQWQLTPTAEDSSGVFCRIFHHPTRNTFYCFYATRPGTSGPMTGFRWKEFDAHFMPTGTEGLLPGFTNAGDMAMVQVGTDYYHITAAPPWDLVLTRFNEDMQATGSLLIPIDPSDSQADMMLNDVHGHLVLGVFHQEGTLHPTMPQQQAGWAPTMHRWEIGLDLVPVGPPVLMPQVFDTWGASCVQDGDGYAVVTMSKWPIYHLNSYRYDAQWNFLDSVALSADGQWSQGAIWADPYYYVAYHSGHEHRAGNITLGIFTADWSPVYDTTITDNSVFVPGSSPPLNTLQHNANRPFLCKVQDTLFIAFDVDDYVLHGYTPPLFAEGQRWQAMVSRWLVNGSSPTGLAVSPEDRAITLLPGADAWHPVLRSDASGEVIVYDLLGRPMFRTTVRAGMQALPLPASARGLCLVRAQVGGQVRVLRYVIA